MREQLTASDIKKIEEEISHRKLVVRKEAIEAVKDDEVETYRLVTSIRGNSMKGLISIESPLGKAIQGHKEGERVHVQVNEKAGYDVVIRKIIKTEDDSQDNIRGF